MPEKKTTHLHNCSCNSCSDGQQIAPISQNSRRDFFKSASAIAAGAVMPASIVNAVSGDEYHAKELFGNKAVKDGKANVFTLLHTSDIHAQLHTHDEFFFENGK
jgi:S-sulfosulfanyl-L-cysteine sulfohydrolase